MRSRALSPRILLLATVVAMHAGVVLVLQAETHTRAVRSETPTSDVFVLPLEPFVRQERRTPAASSRTGPRSTAGRPTLPGAAEAEAGAPAAPSTAIDWGAAAAASATGQIEADRQRARQARALAPKPSPIFARAPRQVPGIAWDYAATHRVQPIGGLTTVIRLNDRCGIVLFVIVPFAGGCALGKPPVRGDLFEHMHDPAPEP